MSTPPAQPQPERMTAQELREAFQHQNERMDQLTEQLSTVTETLNELLEKLAQLPRPVPAPAAATSAGMEIIPIHTISLTYDQKGQPIYHAMGGKYSRFGARIWPEVLPLLGVDPLTLRPGPNAWTNQVQVQPATEGRAPKVIGLA